MADTAACVCGHAPTHHRKRDSVYAGLMADYRVVWRCSWTGCGCPEFVKAPTSRPTTVSQINELLGIDIWRVRSFRANVAIDFDEYGAVLSVTLLNPDDRQEAESTGGTRIVDHT